MKLKLSDKIANWQSVFVRKVSEIKDPNIRCKVLLGRVIELERQSVKLRRLIRDKKLDQRPAALDEHLAYESNSNGAKFYSSKRWLSLRYQFLKKSERVCVLCGSLEELHVDHIIPRSIDPTIALNESNLQILCKQCNFGKSNKDTKRIILRKRTTVQEREIVESEQRSPKP